MIDINPTDDEISAGAEGNGYSEGGPEHTAFVRGAKYAGPESGLAREGEGDDPDVCLEDAVAAVARWWSASAGYGTPDEMSAAARSFLLAPCHLEGGLDGCEYFAKLRGPSASPAGGCVCQCHQPGGMCADCRINDALGRIKRASSA